MALPLKSGADLYTQELLRARLHNFDGDLAEYGTGSIYFNTTSGLNTSDRIRYRGLSAWHSVANLEDIARLEEMIGNLDFAGSEDFIGITSRVAAIEGNFTNGAAKDAVKFGGQLPGYYATQSAFSALQEKVNAFLDGDVDSDAVLENLKEIQAFLDSYDGATSLVDLLDAKADKSQLSGYLPLTGGELNGGLIIKNGSGLYFKDSSGKGILALYMNSANKLILGAGTKETGLSTYIEGTNVYINNSIALHASNFNSYAPTLTGTGASGTWGIDISGKSDSFNPQQITTADLGSEALLNRFFVTRNGAQTDMPTGFMVGFTMSADSNPSYRVQFGMSTVGTIYTRATHGASTYGDWKVVAFTDSNVASATKLQTARKLWGQSFDGTADVSGSLTLSNNSDINGLASDGTSVALMSVGSDDIVRIASGAFYQQKATRLYGKSLAFYTATTPSLLINSAGSVLIGKDTSTGEKLQVNGEITVSNNSYYKITDTSGATLGIAKLTTSNVLSFGYETAYYTGYDTHLYGKNIKFVYGMGNSTAVGMTLNESGYVGIGTPVPQEKLHVVGNLYVTGNIIADGQVSSGGVAEEGTGVGGSLERVAFTIPSGTTSFECEHNLGTKEISVSIYEEGGDYQQILADVYLDSTNIARIVFGRSTDVAHKVVIIG